MDSITQAALGASIAGERAPRPAMNTGVLPLLWARTTGAIPVLCLASLTTPAPGEEC